MGEDRRELSADAVHARRFLDGLGDRPVRAAVDAGAVREVLGGPMPEVGESPEAVIDSLAEGANPGLIASAGPRHFGFVTGGQGANTTGLAAARHAMLSRAGWDVESNGLFGAPRPPRTC
jgi:hypothetical protein